MPELKIKIRNSAVYESGALLIALLTYPGEDEPELERRAKAYWALCKWAVRMYADVDPDWAMKPQRIRPFAINLTDKESDRALRTFVHRLNDRSAAGRMAMAFLQEADLGKPPSLPKGVARLSIAEMANLVMPDTWQAHPENVVNRVWRPSLPVIHIAAALQWMAQTADAKASQRFTIEHVLRSREVLEWVVRIARHYEPLVAKSEKLRGAVPILHRVRLIR